MKVILIKQETSRRYKTLDNKWLIWKAITIGWDVYYDLEGKSSWYTHKRSLHEALIYIKRLSKNYLIIKNHDYFL